LDAGQVFIQGFVAVGFADEQEMSAARQDRLAQSLMGIDVVAEINGIEPSVAFAMGEEPTARGAAFTILLVVAVLWPHELRRQGQGQIASGRDDAGGEHRMIKLGHAIGAFARRTMATRPSWLVRVQAHAGPPPLWPMRGRD